jgi:FixJ family two-component response regulator
LAETINISIVDDDESMREALVGLMESHGYSARAFESAASFLASDSRRRTDCLITDIQMPGMTGLEMLSRLAAAGESLPTILLTVRPDQGARAEALRAGVCCYLSKPFDEGDLLACIRSAVRSRNPEGRR